MSDFKVGSYNKTNNSDSEVKKTSQFERLKAEYEKAKAKLAKSDMANSPTVIENEITILKRLKFLAEKEGRTDEAAEIEDTIESLYIALTGRLGEQPSNAYYPLVNLHEGEANISELSQRTYEFYDDEESEFNPEKFLENFFDENEGLELDDDTREMVLMLGESGSDIQTASYILKKCQKLDGSVAPDYVQAVKMLSSSGFRPNIVSQFIDELPIKNSDMPEPQIDMGLCRTICSMKSLNQDDYACLKLAKLFKSGFKDEAEFKKNALKLLDSGISADGVINLLNLLKTENPQTHALYVDSSTVQSLARIKKSLILSRNNENIERNNLINTKNVQKISTDDGVMIIDKGKISFVSKNSDKSVTDLQKKYEEVISEIEDNLICDFVDKYKQHDGTIDGKYSRTLIALRHAGVCHDDLFDMLKVCFSKGGNYSRTVLSTASQFIQSGLTSANLTQVIDALHVNDDGSFDEKDIQTVIELNKALIPNSVIAKALPDVRNNEELKDMLIDLLPFIPNEECLGQITELVCKYKNESQINAIDIVYNLAELLLNSEKPLKPETFVEVVRDVISKAADPDSTRNILGDDATGIITVMCKAYKPVDEILDVIKACKNQDGYVDSILADKAWDAFVKDSLIDTGSVLRMIDAYKNTN